MVIFNATSKTQVIRVTKQLNYRCGGGEKTPKEYYLAIPKSPTLIILFFVKKIFCVFKSRWRISLSWRYCKKKKKSQELNNFLFLFLLVHFYKSLINSFYYCHKITVIYWNHLIILRKAIIERLVQTSEFSVAFVAATMFQLIQLTAFFKYMIYKKKSLLPEKR